MLNKNKCGWTFILKFSTKMLIRTMNGTLIHDGSGIYEVPDAET